MDLNEIDYNCCKNRDIQFAYSSTACIPKTTDTITTSVYQCKGCSEIFKVREGLDKPPPIVLKPKGIPKSSKVGKGS